MGNIQRPDVTLEDRWESTGQVTLLTGIQAVVRIPLLRHALDAAQGWNTAGYISGYRGSPLGTFDKELGKQAKRLAEANIVFNPGLNEDLAATAIGGSQQIALYPNAKYEGVFGIWYGKGPGVDRSGDALRHANSAGTAPRGGVLALAGDDPSAKSSTVTNTSEYAFVDAEIPMLDPSGVAEVLEYGLKGLAMSRYAGLWVGMKCVAETMDGAATVRIDPAAYATVEPKGFPLPPDGVHIRAKDTPLAALPCGARPMPRSARRCAMPASPRRWPGWRACGSGRSASPGRWMPRVPANSPAGWRKSWWSRTAGRCWSRSSATRSTIRPSGRAWSASRTRRGGCCSRT
jgi:indolepyruvate ferredoxin oxidoreductase